MSDACWCECIECQTWRTYNHSLQDVGRRSPLEIYVLHVHAQGICLNVRTGLSGEMVFEVGVGPWVVDDTKADGSSPAIMA